MLEKVIVSRVKQKTASLVDWQAVWQTFIPLRGEQCVIIIPADSAEGEALGFTKSAQTRHLSKTGDGTLTIGQLPWDGDVYNISQAIAANEQEINRVSALVGEETVQSQITQAFDKRLFIGTLAEYTSAHNAGLIELGTLVYLTDDDGDSLEAVLVEGVLTPGSLPSLSVDGVLQARSLPTLTNNGTLIF